MGTDSYNCPNLHGRNSPTECYLFSKSFQSWMDFVELNSKNMSWLISFRLMSVRLSIISPEHMTYLHEQTPCLLLSWISDNKIRTYIICISKLFDYKPAKPTSQILISCKKSPPLSCISGVFSRYSALNRFLYSGLWAVCANAYPHGRTRLLDRCILSCSTQPVLPLLPQDSKLNPELLQSFAPTALWKVGADAPLYTQSVTTAIQ